MLAEVWSNGVTLTAVIMGGFVMLAIVIAFSVLIADEKIMGTKRKAEKRAAMSRAQLQEAEDRRTAALYRTEASAVELQQQRLMLNPGSITDEELDQLVNSSRSAAQVSKDRR